MARVKRGVTARNRHRKVLKLTKGQKGSKHLLFRRANEAMLKSLWCSHRDRRDRKRDFRRLWITRVNAGARLNGLSYSRLIYGLKLANVVIDRKLLADIAVRDAATFTQLTELARSAAA